MGVSAPLYLTHVLSIPSHWSVLPNCVRVTVVLFPNNLGFRNTLEKSFYILLYLFWGMLGLHCCVGFSVVGESRGYFLVVVHRLLTVVASLVADHRCVDSVVVAPKL